MADDEGSVTEEEQNLWSLLDNINGWIRFADAKAATTIAISGAVASLVTADAVQAQHAAAYLSLSVASLIASSGAIVSALVALLPQTESDKATTVFFGHIARFSNANEYLAAARATRQGDALATEVAEQVHQNSCIATEKYKWVGRGMQFVTAQLILSLLLMSLNTLGAF